MGQGSSLQGARGFVEVKANMWFKVRCPRSLEGLEEARKTA